MRKKRLGADGPHEAELRPIQYGEDGRLGTTHSSRSIEGSVQAHRVAGLWRTPTQASSFFRTHDTLLLELMRAQLGRHARRLHQRRQRDSELHTTVAVRPSESQGTSERRKDQRNRALHVVVYLGSSPRAVVKR